MGLSLLQARYLDSLYFVPFLFFFCENYVHVVRTIYKQNLFDKINEIRYSTECP